MPPQLAGGDDIGGKLGRSAGTLRVEYRAHILDDCKATPVNLTQHWGFNLSASSKQKQDKSNKIDDHTIRLIAYPGEDSPGIRRLETDGRGLPTGKLADIAAGDAHDLAEAGEHGLGRRVGARMPDGGFDHFYVWGFPTFTPPPPGAHPSMMTNTQGPDLTRCILHAPDTHLSLVFRTNQAGVQFYSANGQPPSPAPASQSGGRRKTLHSAAAAAATSSAEETGSTGAGADEEGNAERSAAFLEFGMPHATFLHKELIDALQGHDTVLGPMENYSNWVEVELWKGS
ncbi:hypothetical protein FA10DRAFT_267547 [Acaromyces ingoldii]|uniref:Galactose mutarotase-like protein n=1 Tax=Acaromyces ingoldii TaxID=215250 RepID=A0A316YIM0_9BASI|nr:hypothetical protein FA10DRAFT_267547 [Acaromyces ingoldii]PWN88926.1 hypothetical protein FA10DRAFT_267547 [Acaromyces ingoldii]